jgi:hypothetical protein
MSSGNRDILSFLLIMQYSGGIVKGVLLGRVHAERSGRGYGRFLKKAPQKLLYGVAGLLG